MLQTVLKYRTRRGFSVSGLPDQRKKPTNPHYDLRNPRTTLGSRGHLPYEPNKHIVPYEVLGLPGPQTKTKHNQHQQRETKRQQNHHTSKE